MVVLTDKELVPPPPPYLAVEHARSLSTLSRAASTSVLQGAAHARPAAPTLPAHLVLQIVYKTLERTRTRTREPESAEERIRRTTRTLYWIGSNLRLVNRGFYLGERRLEVAALLTAY